jgi:hypothetical protein
MAEQLARSFIAFCDGIEEGGFADYAGRGRALAREHLEALEQLKAERSARLAIQAERDRFRELLLARGADVG